MKLICGECGKEINKDADYVVVNRINGPEISMTKGLNNPQYFHTQCYNKFVTTYAHSTK